MLWLRQLHMLGYAPVLFPDAAKANVRNVFCLLKHL